MSDYSLTHVYEIIDNLTEMDFQSRQEKLQQLCDTQHPLYPLLAKLFLGDVARTALNQEKSLQDLLFDSRLFSEQFRHHLPDSILNDIRQLVQHFDWDSRTRRFVVMGYQIVEPLSVDSKAASYLGYELALDRNVVVTLAYPRTNAIPAERARFITSAKKLSTIFHPYVATTLAVIDQPATENLPALLGLVYQRVDGEKLVDLLRHHPSLPLSKIASIVQSIVEGLVGVHAHDCAFGKISLEQVIVQNEISLAVISNFDKILAGETQSFSSTGLKAALPSNSSSVEPSEVALTISNDSYGLGELLRNILSKTNQADQGSDDFKVLQTIAVELMDPSPEKRPDIYREVLPKLALISGRQILPLTHDLFSMKMGLHAQKAIFSRRLLMLTGSTLLPFFGVRLLHRFIPPSPSRLPFIPGTSHDIEQAIRLVDKAEKAGYIELDMEVATAFGAKDVLNEHPDSGFITIAPGKLNHDFLTIPFILPELPVRTNLVSIFLLFNAPPGEASCELLVRNKVHSGRWIVQARKSNYIGGPTRKTMSVVVDHKLMVPSTELEFCLRMSTRKAWDGKGRAPIMILVKRHSDSSIDAGSQLLWTSEF
jgi:serine/threonine protein kinase